MAHTPQVTAAASDFTYYTGWLNRPGHTIPARETDSVGGYARGDHESMNDLGGYKPYQAGDQQEHRDCQQRPRGRRFPSLTKRCETEHFYREHHDEYREPRHGIGGPRKGPHVEDVDIQPPEKRYVEKRKQEFNQEPVGRLIRILARLLLGLWPSRGLGLAGIVFRLVHAEHYIGSRYID
jgi:hypothetical protein